MRTILTRLAVLRTGALLSAFLIAVCAACNGTGYGCQ